MAAIIAAHEVYRWRRKETWVYVLMLRFFGVPIQSGEVL
jgi:hypothetical protein